MTNIIKKENKPLLDEIIDVICNYMDITRDAFYTRNRLYALVLSRHLYFYFALQTKRYSLDEIGGYVGFDHATVIHGRNRIKDMLSVGIKSDIELISNIAAKIDNTSMSDFYKNIIDEKLMLYLDKCDEKRLNSIIDYINGTIKKRKYEFKLFGQQKTA